MSSMSIALISNVFLRAFSFGLIFLYGNLTPGQKLAPRIIIFCCRVYQPDKPTDIHLHKNLDEKRTLVDFQEPPSLHAYDLVMKMTAPYFNRYKAMKNIRNLRTL